MYLTEYADYNHKLILHIPYLQHGRAKIGEHGDAEQQTNLQGEQGMRAWMQNNGTACSQAGQAR